MTSRDKLEESERFKQVSQVCALYERTREFEYIRHDTLCVTANLEISTGKVVSPRIRETRTNIDFVEEIDTTTSEDPDGRWFSLWTISTRTSQRSWFGTSPPPSATTVMSKSGVLKSRAPRTEFLSEPSHRIRFVFTRRHCSWLNQFELWFSVLARRVHRRGSFTSKQDLHDKLLAFIDYFNAVLATPCRWTCTGKPVAA